MSTSSTRVTKRAKASEYLIDEGADIAIVGVDMSSQTADTAACVLSISGNRLKATAHRNVTDDSLLRALKHPNARLGIDAPFGWPTPFTEFAAKWSVSPTQRSGVPTWASLEVDGSWSALAEVLKFRATDRFVRLYLRGVHDFDDDYSSRWPDGFSVAADKIALTALRTIRLLAAAEITDLVGQSGRVVEVYPGPTLAAWDLTGKGYKGARRSQGTDSPAYLQRVTAAAKLVDQLRTSTHFDVDELSFATLEQRAAETDHVLDALVCALTTWAAKVGRTHLVDGESAQQFWNAKLERGGNRSESELREVVGDDRSLTQIAAIEGWIHHPTHEPSDFLAIRPI